MLDTAMSMIRSVTRLPDDGLAVFVGDDLVECFVIPDPGATTVHVGARPNLVRTIEALHRRAEFHLLTLSQHHTALYRCDERGATPVDDVEIPESTEEAFWYEDLEPTIAVHGGVRSGNGSIAGTVSGGSAHDLHEARLRRYVALVDAALPPDVHDGRLPLVVAAVGQLGSMIRAARPHRDLIVLDSLGSPDHVPMDQIRLAAHELVLAQRGEHDAELLDRFRELDGTGRTATGPEAVADAANAGQAETVFLDADVAHGSDAAAAEVLSTTVAAAVSTGAAVVIVPHGSVGAPVVATLRY